MPIIRSWALTRGFALHPGTRNRYKIRYTRTQHRPASRQVNDHGRVSGTHTLWGSHLSRRGGSVSHRHGGFEPPFDVEQHPPLVGVVSDRLHEQIMANAVEEGPDIEIEHPVLVPTTLASHGQRVVGTSPRPVPGSCRGGRSAQASLPPASLPRSEPPGLPHSPHREPWPRPHDPSVSQRFAPAPGNSSPRTSDSTACRGCPPLWPRNRRRSQRPRPALHCSLGPSPTPRKRDAFRISNDFNFCFGRSVGSSPEPLTSKRP